MSDNNIKESLNAAEPTELSDKDLSTVTGGAAGANTIPELLKEPQKLDAEELISRIDRDALIKSNQQAQTLVDLINAQSQEKPQKTDKVFKNLAES